MIDARRATALLSYNGTDISAHIEPMMISLDWTDFGTGRADTLEIKLEDSLGLWRGDWFPDEGATIVGALQLSDWDAPGQRIVLPCGTFQIDKPVYDGPPAVMALNCLSTPITSSLRRQQKTRAWEQLHLRDIALDISTSNNLALFWDATYNPLYSRRDQIRLSDIDFLHQLAVREGLGCKVTDKQIAIYDEQTYEAKASVFTIDYLSTPFERYNFTTRTHAAYKSVKFSYFDPKTKKDTSYEFTPKNAPATGETLVLHERVQSQADAERVAKKRLRMQNKRLHDSTITLPGNPHLVSGQTVTLKNWGHYDDTYFIYSVKHSLARGNGYTSVLDMRKTLAEY